MVNNISTAWRIINQAIKGNAETINKYAATVVDAYNNPETAHLISECEKLLDNIAAPLVTVSMKSTPEVSDCISDFMAYIADDLMLADADKKLVIKLAGDDDGFALAMLRYCGSFYTKIIKGTEEHSPYDDIPESKRNAILKLKKAIKELGLFDATNEISANYWTLTNNARDEVICWIRKNVRDNKTLTRSEFEQYLSICNPPFVCELVDEDSKDIDISDGGKSDPSNNDYTSLENSNLVYSLQLLKDELIKTSRTEKAATRKFDIFMTYIIYKTSDLNAAIDGFAELGKHIEWAGNSDFESKIDTIKASNGKAPTVVDYGTHFGIDMRNYNVALYSALDTLKATCEIPCIYRELFSIFDPRMGK